MLTTQTIIDNIQQLAPNTLIAPTGSRILPYIQHPRDEDYAVICNNDSDCEAIKNYLLTIKPERPQGVHWMVYTQENIPLHRMWSYEFHFGEPYLDVFYEPQRVERVLQTCQRYRTTVTYWKDKSCYHFYTTCCLILNGNYTLTDDEIARINRFHDSIHTTQDVQELNRLWDIIEKQYNVPPVNKPRLINKASVC